MKKLFPTVLAVILAFVLVSPALAGVSVGQAETRIAVNLLDDPNGTPICSLPAGVLVILTGAPIDINEGGHIARWWPVKPAYQTEMGIGCAGYVRSGALTNYLFYWAKK